MRAIQQLSGCQIHLTVRSDGHHLTFNASVYLLRYRVLIQCEGWITWDYDGRIPHLGANSSWYTRRRCARASLLSWMVGYPKNVQRMWVLLVSLPRGQGGSKRKVSTKNHLVHWRIILYLFSPCYERDPKGTTLSLSICLMTEGGTIHVLSKKIDRIYPEGYTTLPQ